MLNVFQSNRLEALVAILSKQIEIPASENLFVADTVMVQSPGMSQWLKLQLAQQNGIVANVDFPLPSSFIWRLYQHLLEGVPEQSPYNKDRLTWKIVRLLPARLEQDEFIAVKEYLHSVKSTTQSLDVTTEPFSTSHSQLRLYQLAQKIADVFDNYLMYRQHWLDHWQQGHNDLPEDGSNDDIKAQQWQAILWRDIVTDTEQQYQNNQTENPLNRAQMHQLLIDVLAQPDNSHIKSLLPPRLFVFGISTLPSHQLEILDALSKHIDVQILWLNPCSQYWGDILSDKTLARLNTKQAKIATLNIEQQSEYFIVGNPLLATWGKIGRDYLDNLTNSDFDITDVFIEQESDSLLTDIQQDILQLQFRAQQQPLTPEQIRAHVGKKVLHKHDDSILIHNCHSRFRELEVLKDKLLGWMSDDPTLMPKDVLVMVPNIDQYAPFIDAVFARSHSNQANSFIPYTIADRSGLEQEPLLTAFSQWLNLPSSRFTVSEMVDYLELPIMMAKFKLTQQELELIKFWLNECHIKWGKNAEHKAKWGLPEFNLNTWMYGLKRMVLGFALGKDAVWQDVLAYQHIEGLNAHVLAKLLDYFQFVMTHEQLLASDKTLEHWHRAIESMIADWSNDIDLSVKEHLAIQKLRDVNTNLLSYFSQQDFEEQISYKIIQQYFIEHLNDSGVVQRFLAGSMNFCTLMPMRSVPFKIICVLGLNEGDYPRQVDPISFDLVGLNTARKGDRSRKFDDRYLFLEALVSARQKLHLSYIGQSSKNNQPLMPSVILSELMDYIDQSHLHFDHKELASDQTSVSDQNIGSGEDQSELMNDQIKSSLKQVMIKHYLQPYDLQYYQAEQAFNHYKPFDNKWFELAKNKQAVLLNEESESTDNTVTDPQLDHESIEKEANKDLKNKPSIDFASLQEQQDQIDLNDVLVFYKNPIQYYYRQQLGITLDFYSSDIDDDEVFEHDGLTRYQWLEKLTQQHLFSTKEAGSSTLIQEQLLSGAFPNQNWGVDMLANYQQTSEQLIQAVQQLVNGELHFESVSISKPIDLEQNIQLSAMLKLGSIKNHKNSNLSLIIRNGEIRGQDQINLYLTHLVKCASGHSGLSIIVNNKAKVGWLAPLPQHEAEELLTDWLNVYREYKQTILPWHIDLALIACKNKQKGLSELQAQHELNKPLKPAYKGRNLSDNEYVMKVIKQASDLTEAFYQVSSKLCEPMIERLTIESFKKAQEKLEMAGEE